MTETYGNDPRRIAANADIIYEAMHYEGVGRSGDATLLVGPEIEFFIIKLENGVIKPLDNNDATVLEQTYSELAGPDLLLSAEAKKLHQEVIVSHFELNYPPVDLAGMPGLMDQYHESLKVFANAAEKSGFLVIPSSHAPHINGVEDIKEQIANHRDRVRIMFQNASAMFGEGIYKFANTTAGIHTSSAYKDMDHFESHLRREYDLAPFIFALSNNGFSCWNGFQPANHVNPRLAAMLSFASGPQARSGIDPLYYSAGSGEEFLTGYIDRIISTPMLGYYDHSEGGNALLRSIEELGDRLGKNVVSFKDLEEVGLNTVDNYQFAASCWWYGVKIQDIPVKDHDDEHSHFYKRLESRHWNTGPWQLPAALAVRGLMGLDDACGQEVDELLARQGFRSADASLRKSFGNEVSSQFLKDAVKNAMWRGDQGLNIPYGNGTMKEFANGFLDIIERYADKYNLTSSLAPMADIIRHNRTDAQVLAERYPTPEKTMEFIRNIDHSKVLNPSVSLRMLEARGVLPGCCDDRKKGSNSDTPSP